MEVQWASLEKSSKAYSWRVLDAMLRNLDLVLKEMESKCARAHWPPTKLFSWPCSMERLY